MHHQQKAKTVGKIIIIVLSLAILFFLLLPFLGNPSANTNTENKKATPQIFTSNPLSDLVQKVYTLFKKDTLAPTPTHQDMAMSEEMLENLPPQEQQKYALKRAEESAENFQYDTAVDATYDYDDAGIVNEDGEWILVRQTAPESATPGMHEVTTRDNAYDRHIRQERAARYTGKASDAAGPAIPDSKWARLWKPIKSFFTGEEEEKQTQEMPDTRQESSYQLASAGSGLGKDTHKQGSTYRKGDSANLSVSDWETGSGKDNGFYDVLSPHSTLKNIADAYLKTAKETLKPDQFEAYKSKVDKYVQEHQAEMEQQSLNKNWELLAKAAEGQKLENLVEKTIFEACSPIPTSSLYSMGEVRASCGEKPKTPEELYKEEEKAEKIGQEKLQRIKEVFHIDTPEKEAAFQEQPLDMMVLLGKTEGNPFKKIPDPQKGINIFNEKTQKWETIRSKEELQKEVDLAKEMIDFVLEKQGCAQEGGCYWVGGEVLMGSPELRQTVLSSGMGYMGDPLKVFESLVHEFTIEKADAETDEYLEINNRMQKVIQQYFKYIPYNAANMEQLNQRNQEGSKDKFLYFIPHAADALNMKEVLPHPTHIVYDGSKEKEILDYNSQETPLQRGERLHLQILDRLSEAHEVKHDVGAVSDAHKYCATELLKQTSQNIREEMKKNENKNMDEQMGILFDFTVYPKTPA